ncbi:hypothetical protein O181_049297 [Austropuccinia psidii MF-1]|uniref:Uncharacterized protein n=1 Tax=Austropuccinia psidii MF-1 TaxID=1389203 RepID=A0A9Q3E1J4_9BASI|nr:hypothetical protein [Austropuccinia psidii MF-1]
MKKLPFPTNHPQPIHDPNPADHRSSRNVDPVASHPQNLNHQTSSLTLRPRRPYYTPSTPRQFSDSAAKRESVMALGSIAHLQHYFIKNGLATKNKPIHHKHMILAVPGRDPDSFTEEDEDILQNLPPEPAPPPQIPSQPYFPAGRALPNLTDLESARKEVMAQLDRVCELWGLIELTSTRAPSVASNRSGDDSISHDCFSLALQKDNSNPIQPLSSSSPDRHGDEFVVNLLTLTTHAVRSVQKFILTIPDPDLFSVTSIGSLGSDSQRRMPYLELSTAARPRISRSTNIGLSSASRASSPAPSDSQSHSNSWRDPFVLFKKRTVSNSSVSTSNLSSQSNKDDPLSILRRMSLEVLGCLKDIEHRYRIPGSATPTLPQDFSILNQSEPGSSDIQYSSPQQLSSNLTEDPTSGSGNSDRQDETQSDGSLSLPSVSWEYRQDISLEEVRKEALVVKQWLECVDGILEGLAILTGTRRKKVSKLLDQEFKKENKKKPNMFKRILSSSKFNNGSFTDERSATVPEIALGDAIDDESETEDVEDDETLLPDWARLDRFTPTNSLDDEANHRDQQLNRLFFCLVSHLPNDLLFHMSPPHGESGSRITFLDSLSDGTLLCLAYNVALRQSQRPWGFIPVESIHNLATLTSSFGSSTETQSADSTVGKQKCGNPTLGSAVEIGVNPSGKVGITFRRLENLRVWAAALKLRYLIKSESDEAKSNNSSAKNRGTTSPTANNISTNLPSNARLNQSIIKFDARVVARRLDGWEEMLESMALRWLESVKSEKREEVLGH